MNTRTPPLAKLDGVTVNMFLSNSLILSCINSVGLEFAEAAAIPSLKIQIGDGG